MMIYDIHMHLNPFNTITSDGSKYITSNFNINIKNIHIVYHSFHSCSISTF